MKKYAKLLSVVLAVLMLSAMLSGCNNDDQAKGQVIIGNSTEANGDWAYGAFTSSINATDQDVITLTDDTVTVTSDKNGDYVLNKTVVKDYKREEDADGNATYTFEINKGLKFNNGEEIKAENFLAWTLFVISPAGKEMGTVSNSYDMIPGGHDYKDGKVNYLAGLRLIDDYKFSATVLKEGKPGDDGSDPTTYLPYYYDLGYAAYRAVNLKYWFGDGWHVKDDGQGAYLVNDNGTEFTADNIKDKVTAAQYSEGGDRITAGPYNLVKFDKSANEITLEVNENYAGDFQGQKPHIAKIIIVKTEDETVIDSLSTGGIQIYSGIADGEQVNAAIDLIDQGTIDSSFCQYDRAGYGYFAFACDLGPAQYTEFRQAVAYLLDREQFAKTFCAGWGGVVHGPYCTAFSMYEDTKDELNKALNTYSYNPDKAVELLKAAEFVYNEDGTDYVDGSGLVRYKKVSEEEAANYDNFVKKLDDGTILMPAELNWASSTNNSVSELLVTMLANGEATKNAGVKITQNLMTFPELLNYMYRQDAYGIGGADYSVPTYNMFNLATGWSSGVYDFSFEFTTNQEYIDQGYNTTHLYDEQLDKLSMDMVYGVTEYKDYLPKWKEFVLRYNELLPQVPLYSNIYVTIYPNTIENYEENSFWGYSRAILYANYIGKE